MRLLERTLALQREVFGFDPPALRNGERAAYVRDNVLAATDELHELLHEVEWKPWKKTVQGYGSIARERYIDELADVLHFIGNLGVVAGITDEELEAAYLMKVAENTRRQEALHS